MTRTIEMTIKHLLVAAALVFSHGAFAVGANVGDNCTLAWTHPDPSTVDSSALYGGQSPGDRNALGDVGNVTTIRCTGVGSLNLANGQWYVVVRAVNAAGESGDSNEVPFFLGPPAAPSTLTVGP